MSSSLFFVSKRGLFFVWMFLFSFGTTVFAAHSLDEIVSVEHDHLLLLKKYIDSKAIDDGLLLFQQIKPNIRYSQEQEKKETFGELALALSELCFLNERAKEGLALLEELRTISFSHRLSFYVEQEIGKRRAQIESPEKFCRYLQEQQKSLPISYLSFQDECLAKILQEALTTQYDFLLEDADRLFLLENYEAAFQKYEQVLKMFCKEPVCFNDELLKNFFKSRVQKDMSYAYLKHKASFLPTETAEYVRALAGYFSAFQEYERICETIDLSISEKSGKHASVLDRFFLDQGINYYTLKQKERALTFLKFVTVKEHYKSAEEKRAAFLSAKILLEKLSYDEVVAIIRSWEQFLQEEECFTLLFLKGILAYRQKDFFRAAQFLGRAVEITDGHQGSHIGEALQLLGCSFIHLFLNSSHQSVQQDSLNKAGDVFFKAAKNHGVSEGIVGFAYVLRLKKEKGMKNLGKEEKEITKFFSTLSDTDKFWVVRQSLAGGNFLQLEPGDVRLQAGKRDENYYEETLIRELYKRPKEEYYSSKRLLNLTETLIFHFCQRVSMEPLDGIYQLVQEDLLRSLKAKLWTLFERDNRQEVKDYLEGVFAIVEGKDQPKRLLQGLSALLFLDIDEEDRLFLEGCLKFALFNKVGDKAKATGIVYRTFCVMKKCRYQLKLRLLLGQLGIHGRQLFKHQGILWEEYSHDLWADECFFLEYSFKDYLSGSEEALKHLGHFQELFPNSSLQPLVFYLLGTKESCVNHAIYLLKEAMKEDKLTNSLGKSCKGQAYFHYRIKEMLADTLFLKKEKEDLLQAVSMLESIKRDFSLKTHPFVSQLDSRTAYTAIIKNVDYLLARGYLCLNRHDDLIYHVGRMIESYLNHGIYRDPSLAYIWRMLGWVFSHRDDGQTVVMCLRNADKAKTASMEPFPKYLPHLIEGDEDSEQFLSLYSTAMTLLP